MGKHLVLVGGGHAHLTALKNLSSFIKLGHRVTLIGPSRFHYYSGMGPGMLSGIYPPWEVRFHVKKLAEDQGATFIKDKVIRVDPGQHLLLLSSGAHLSYDVVSFNIGSDVPLGSLMATPNENVFAVKPVVNLLKARRLILDAIRSNGLLRYLVIGGGAAGLEITANFWRLLREKKGKSSITVIGGKRLLGDGPEKLRRLALASLTGRGVQVIEGSHVKGIDDGLVTLSDGRTFGFDLALVAIGIRPPSIFRDSGLPTGPDGGLLVNAHLQCVADPNIFGGGDCISLEGYALAKVGVYAVRENPVLYHNLLAAVEGGSMITFRPQKHYLLIFNLGNGRGIFWKKDWVFENRFAFTLKDYIDRSFMRKFQVSGERKERSEEIE